MAQREAQRIVFRGAKLLDGDNPAQPDASVVVEGERIARVARGETPPARPGDRVIELAGRTLMPGLWSCHFHSSFADLTPRSAPSLGLEHTPTLLVILAEQNLRTALECGVTAVVGSTVPYHIDASLRAAINFGMIPGPRMWAGSHELCTSGDMTDARNRMWHYELGNIGAVRVVDGPDAFRQAVREEIARGADVVKVNASYGHGASAADETIRSISPEELRAASQATHERNRKIRAHAASKRAILDTARAGFDVIDHADRVDAECIEAILDAGAAVVPSAFYNQRLLELYDNLDPRDPLNPMGGSFESPQQTVERVRGVREDFDYTCRMLPELRAAGVRLVVGDDFGTILMRHGEYAAELEFYVKQVGIPPLDVIRWATKNGAELVDAGEELGTVSEGKLADLLVVDGDPLADITCLQERDKLLAIVKGGYFVKDALPAA